MQRERPELEIAVVGLGGVFPGATSPAQFWDNIVAGRSCVRPVPEDRWIVDPGKVVAPMGGPDRVPHSIGGYVDNFSLDVSGLGIHLAAEFLQQLDPLYLFGLHAAGQALNDANLDAELRRRAGVVMAAIALPSDGTNAITRSMFGTQIERQLFGDRYSPLNSSASSAVNGQVCGLPAALIARGLGLGGGAYTLDAACASSLYAVKLACDELASGRRDVMVAGGLSCPDPLYTQMGFTQLQALSPTGVCAPFDATSNGLIVGEGAGALVLKRLDDAVTANDRIYAVIRGIGVSNDIGGSLLAPDSEGQLRAMRAAYEMAGWRPDEIDLIECHGTGTPRGDASEVRSLLKLWAGAPQRARPCAIGSVKSMIGHLLTAAGAAGLIKTIMALQQRVLPPSANYSDCGAVIPLRGSPFSVQTRAEAWPQPAPVVNRKAAVSAFGFGGINGHVLMEEWPDAAGTSSTRVAATKGGRVEVTDREGDEPIAIVGIDARFGALVGIDAFAAAVLSGETESRGNGNGTAGHYQQNDGVIAAPIPACICQLPVAVGEFKIPPNEILSVLPQQLLMLQSAAAALDDAGMPRREARPHLGAIIGMAFDMETTNFHLRWWLREVAPQWAAQLNVPAAERGAWVERLIESVHDALNAPGVVGNLGGMIASRVAREIGSGGPSFGVSSGATSALHALDIAVRALRRKEIDACLVGGVDFAAAARLRGVITDEAIDKAAHRHPLDAQAGPTCFGDGAGAMIVKRLSDAQREGDRIYAVVHDLRHASAIDSNDYTNGDGSNVSRAVHDAFQDALNASESVGCSLGLLEIAAECDDWKTTKVKHFVSRLIEDGRFDTDRCVNLSNVAGTVGTPGAATGMASLLSSVLALAHKRLPVARRFGALWPQAPESSIRINVPIAPQYWYHDLADGPRGAGVIVANGNGGASVAILAEHQTEAVRREFVPMQLGRESMPAVFSLAANDVGELIREVDALHADLAAGDVELTAVAAKWATKSIGRSVCNHRLSFLAKDHLEASRRIELVRQHLGEQPANPIDGRDGIYFVPASFAIAGKTALVFPGSGNQYLGMGRALHAALAPLMARIEGKYERLATELMARWVMPWRSDWRDDWRGDAKQTLAEDMRRVIFAQVTFGMVMHDLLGELGIRPDAVIGYSLGESTSLFATRAWPDDEEMLRRMMASSLFKDDLYDARYALQRAWHLTPSQAAAWQTAILPRPADEVRPALEGLFYARLMIVNTPSECVVGGMPDEIATAAKRLACRAIPVEDVPTVHIDAVREVEDAYRVLHVMDTERPSGIDLYSCHLGRRYDVTQQMAAESITAQALHGFDFTKVIESAYADGVRRFLEVGPQASCTRMIRRTLGARSALVVSASGRPEEELEAIANFLAACCAYGLPVRLDKVFKESATRHKLVTNHAGKTVVVPVGMAVPDLSDLPYVGVRSDGDASEPFDVVTESDESVEQMADCRDALDFGTCDAPITDDNNDAAELPNSNDAVAVAAQYFEAERSSYQDDDSDMTLTDDMQSILAAGRATAAAHERYFAFAEAAREGLTAAAQVQAELMQQALASGQMIDLGALAAEVSEPDSVSSRSTSPTQKSVPQPQRGRGTHGAITHGTVTNGAVTLGARTLTEGANGTSAIGVDIDNADTSFDSGREVHRNDDGARSAEPPTVGGSASQIEPMFPRELCMEFAVGKLANVLGPMFADVDSYPVRVRLPDWPLMLVDRIMTVEGEMGSLTGGRIVTEHDVHDGAWYLDGNCAPVCVTVEAGQADLFLSSYLGIDLAVKGTRAYRLLDATVTFHRHLPRPGETIHYDIHIDRFVRQGETYLFFFRFDGTINGETVLTMRDGCAGFFTDAEIENSGGIILTKADTAPTAGKRDESFVEIVPMQVESYDDEQVAALRQGDLAACFGPMFADLGLRDPLNLPDGRMKLFDRVLELDPTGGRFGLGRIRAEADIHPDDWFLTCHFIDDMTMPGTLMYECCVHALRFFLLRMGWVGEAAGVSYEPLHNLSSALKCRGPVTQATKKVIYEVDIKEIGYNPKPYVIADALMLGDGRKIVRMTDMSLEIQGLSRAAIEAVWDRRAHGDVPQPQRGRGTVGEKRRNVETSKRQNLPTDDTAKADTHALNAEAARLVLYDKQSIIEFSNGRPSLAFGEPYTVFDSERVIARLPGPPFQFLDRVVAVDAEPFVLKPTGWIETEYDVPPDAWYFAANRQPTMPFAVILEAALQPCGWLAAYCGSALRSKTDLSFRNLGGTATLHREIYPDVGTLTVRVRMTNVNEAGGMIIQDYDMQLSDARGVVYEGVTHFGFFSKAALAQQVGVRDAGERRYTPSADELGAARQFEFDILPPILPQDAAGIVCEHPGAQRGLYQPAKAFLMLERVDALTTTGGPNGLGFVRGSTGVNPEAWFFKAHFYQDPVWPGSLGLESFLQLLKAYALERWGAAFAQSHSFEAIAAGVEQTWVYRGQVIPKNQRVDVEAVITRVDDGAEPLVMADGFLVVDGIPIYEMKDFAVRLVRR